MNWIKYFLFLLFSVFLSIIIIFSNERVSRDNKKISSYTRTQNFLLNQQAKLDELRLIILEGRKEEFLINRINIILEELETEFIMNPLLNKYYKENDKLFNQISDVSEIDTIFDTKETFEFIQNERNLLVEEILSAKDFRDYSFGVLIIFIFLKRIWELIKIKRETNKISKYLKNIIYKKYDFSIKASPLPYINNILNDISYIKTNLEIIDNSILGIMKGYSIKETLEELSSNEDFKKYINFHRIGIATVEKEHFVAGISINRVSPVKLKRGFKIKKTDSPSLSKIVEKREIRIINDLEKHLEDNPKSKSTQLILEEGFRSNLTVPLFKGDGRVVGILFFSSIEKNAYKQLDIYKIQSLTEILSYVFEKNMLIEDLVTNSVLSFVKLVEGKDPETSNHLDRMAYYSKIIARKLSTHEKYQQNMDYYYIDNLLKYAPLHDIGKVGIPDNILLKPGKLSESEFEIMKNHTKIGARILSYFQNNLRKYDINVFKMAVQIAVAHHEKWNGKGYPNGIAGEKIPLAARIVAVADVFDALSSKRIYKNAFPFDESVRMVNELSGESFDPDVVEAFNEGLEEIREIYDRMKEV